MDALAQLEYLSLVAKVLSELENHFGINDKVLGMCIHFSLALILTTF